MSASIDMKHSKISIGISNVTLEFPEINAQLPLEDIKPLFGRIDFPLGNFFPELSKFIYFPLTNWSNFWRDFFSPALYLNYNMGDMDVIRHSARQVDGKQPGSLGIAFSLNRARSDPSKSP